MNGGEESAILESWQNHRRSALLRDGDGAELGQATVGEPKRPLS